MKLDGRKLAEEIRSKLTLSVEELKKKGITPHLAVVLIGDNPSSLTYINQKRIQAEKVGVKFTLHHFTGSTASEEIIATIKQLGSDSVIHGLIVQRPIPAPFTNELTNLVPFEKDVDGFLSDSPFDPPVALAVIKCLEAIYFSNEVRNNNIEFLDWLGSKKIVILGRGETAGKPIARSLTKHQIPFSVIHSQTSSRETLLKNADIIISAVGKPEVFKAHELKPNVIVIGIGLHEDNGKLVGDFSEKDIETIASYFTPTPGGTGPVNVASLIENVVRAALH